VELLQAVAATEVGTAAEKTDAVVRLDAKLAEEEPGSELQAEAAYYRLTACVSPAHAVWSDEAERVLVETGHRRAAIIPQVFVAAFHHASYEEARDLLVAEGDERWAIATRLHLAGAWGQQDELERAAQAALAISPSQDLRVEAGVAFLRAGRVERGVEVLNDAADSNDTPSVARAEAYYRLVKVAIEAAKWDRADDLHKRWVRDTPGDKRASVLAPTIARRLDKG
jgi:tetratricopeptide (TPR) repeat protein